MENKQIEDAIRNAENAIIESHNAAQNNKDIIRKQLINAQQQLQSVRSTADNIQLQELEKYNERVEEAKRKLMM